MPIIEVHYRHDHYYHNQLLEREIMAVSAQVQQILDGVRQNQSLLSSVEDGLAAQATLIQNQTVQIAALEAKLANGTNISADDLAALAEINTDVSDVNTRLKADIPANTGKPGSTDQSSQVDPTTGLPPNSTPVLTGDLSGVATGAPLGDTPVDSNKP
jgi:hypothetical protein